MATYSDVTKRQDFVLLFDVTDGNPNGDPDAGNLPRIDQNTLQGMVTDVAIKRKVRDFVDLTHGTESRFKIYVQHQGILANEQRRAFEALGKGPTDRPDNDAKKWMCDNFFDIRMFGAVMTTGKSGQRAGSRDLQWNAGQVRGPLQLTFSRSIDPIEQHEWAITRVALTNADDTRPDISLDEEVAVSGQFGRKSTVPYGLYRTHGFFNPHFAKDTGVLEEDLELFWQALQMMWDQDHSAARGQMNCRGLYVFTHDSSLGNAPAYTLFDRIQVARKEGVEAPRKFADYAVEINDTFGLPAGVTLTRLVG